MGGRGKERERDRKRGSGEGWDWRESGAWGLGGGYFDTVMFVKSQELAGTGTRGRANTVELDLGIFFFVFYICWGLFI